MAIDENIFLCESSSSLSLYFCRSVEIFINLDLGKL